jgi:NTE family protein
MREMRMIAKASGFCGAGYLARGVLARRLLAMRFHMVDTNHVESLQRSETKLIAYAPFLELLRAQGRQQAAKWLDEHWPDVGRRATADIQQLFG